MSKLQWDQTGERRYETGVSRGVLYSPDNTGVYVTGVAWNGLVTVTESPSGAEASPQYADNIKYLNLISAEDFGATIEAFTYPDEFMVHDGTAELAPGVTIGQQNRRPFGLSYQTLIGNDLEGTDYGYKIHLVYGCQAAPTEKAFGTVNDSPEAITFSWELTTNPVDVPGFKPTAIITIDSTQISPAKLAELEEILYGAEGVDPRLPTPTELAAILAAGPATRVTPTAPAYNAATKTITIPTVTGVVYTIDGKTVAAGAKVITVDTVVRAVPAPGYLFTVPSDDDWLYEV